MGLSVAIQCVGLTKMFARRRGYQDLLLHPLNRTYLAALHEVNLTIHQGELVGLLGPNGAGKTTLLKLLATLILPTSGTALINSYDIRQEASLVKSQVGFVFSDERSFYWRLTGRENLMFFAALHHLFGSSQRTRVTKVLAIVGLEDVADRPFGTYSTGMRQRLAIARALLPDPVVLLMDEPTKGVDPLVAAALRTFIREELVTAHGKTVLMATHHVEDVEDMCDRVVVLANGCVRADGPLDSIRTDLRLDNNYTVVVDYLSPVGFELLRQLGHITIRNGHLKEGGNGQVEMDLSPFTLPLSVQNVAQIAAVNGGCLIACAPRRASLTEILEHLTGRGGTSVESYGAEV